MMVTVSSLSVCLVFINHPCPKMGAAASGRAAAGGGLPARLLGKPRIIVLGVVCAVNRDSTGSTCHSCLVLLLRCSTKL